MISHEPEHHPKNNYQVRVGHTIVNVDGLDRADAIQAARTRLCLDMPRFWDVIQSIDDQRFEVKSASD